MLLFQNISKNYRHTQALRNFTADLDHGIYGLLGPNGAGKTTLIKILVGILRANCGQIFYHNEAVQHLGVDFLAHIGYLPQNAAFYPDFRVDEFLLYMAALKGVSPKIAQTRSLELLDQVNLSDAAQIKIGEMSGGMLQRLGIAQAMINDPEILVLDEPTAGLDPKERIRFRNIISALAGERLILLSTHIVSDIESIATQVLLIRKGQLILQGSPKELEKKMDGKVWQVESSEEMARRYALDYNVSNIFREDERLFVRILSDKKPHQNAVALNANLEDVFLFHIEES